MADDKQIKHVQSAFSMYGLVITRNVATFVAKQLVCVPPENRELWLTKITDQILNLNLQDPHISLDHVKQAIKECVRPPSFLDDSQLLFNVIDLKDIPQITYDISTKKFVVQKVSLDNFAEAISKSNVFRNRLCLLKHRTLRLEPFAPKKFGEKNKEKKKLVPIEFLLTDFQTEDVYVMGILSQLIEGKYFLEDTGGTAQMDLTEAKQVYDEGLLTEGCVVIVHGYYEDEILHVKNIHYPPIEPSASSRAPFGTDNTFGGRSKISLKCSEKLQMHEKENLTGMIVIISELWLDDARVLDKFRIILEGYADEPPIAFIICGRFLSCPSKISSGKKLKEGFEKLSKLINYHPEIRDTSKFVFVPSLQDLGAAKIFPRGPLPRKFLDNILKEIPGAILAGNPCRIQYCTKEIVVFREDMIAKIGRNTIKYPDTGDFHHHYAKTMISQAHLAPMSLPVLPIYWKHDHALQLYPMPDLIIVADSARQYTTKIDECQVINPGTFPKNNFSFKVYRPGTNEVEDCELPDDDDNDDDDNND